jgi:hypothetical protein
MANALPSFAGVGLPIEISYSGMTFSLTYHTGISFGQEMGMSIMICL